MDRKSLFDFARERWGVEPDCPFADYPEVAVLRHTDSGKWFALVMPVKAEKLGLAGRARGEEVDVVNLKLQPPLVTMILEKEGAFPAYHMNRKHWISDIRRAGQRLPGRRAAGTAGTEFPPYPEEKESAGKGRKLDV